MPSLLSLLLAPQSITMLRGRLFLDVLTDRRLWCQQFLAGLHSQGLCVLPAQGKSLFKVNHVKCISFFLWGSSNFPHGEAHQKPYMGNLTPETLHHVPHKVLVVQITTFLPSVENLALLLYEEGAGTLQGALWGTLGLCAQWGSRPPGACKVAEHGALLHMAEGFPARSAASCLPVGATKQMSVCLLAPMEQ
jgi:hypothetical protein